MQKWEYLFVKWIPASARWEANEFGVTVALPPGPTNHHVANYYGNQGWELVAVDTNWHNLIFKRPSE